jgi:hypothetical protein
MGRRAGHRCGAERIARSRVMSPQLLSPNVRKRFPTVISDVATTGTLGSGVCDAGQKCLLGIMSRKIYVPANSADVARYFVPAPTIRAFIPTEYRFKADHRAWSQHAPSGTGAHLKRRGSRVDHRLNSGDVEPPTSAFQCRAFPSSCHSQFKEKSLPCVPYKSKSGGVGDATSQGRRTVLAHAHEAG